MNKENWLYFNQFIWGEMYSIYQIKQNKLPKIVKMAKCSPKMKQV